MPLTFTRAARTAPAATRLAVALVIVLLALLAIAAPRAHATTSSTAPNGFFAATSPFNCFTTDQGGGPVGCTGTKGIWWPNAIVVSPDGRNVYVGSNTMLGGVTPSASIAEFSRASGTAATWGNLTSLPTTDACITFDHDGVNGADVAGCTIAAKPNNNQISQISDMAMSDDGKFLYVTYRGFGTDGSIAWYSRNLVEGANFGALTFVDCLTSAGGGSGGCGMAATRVETARAIAISHDGESAYAAGDAGNTSLATFTRNPTTGALTPKSCLTGASGTTPTCATTGRGITMISDIVVTNDDAGVIVSSSQVSTFGAVASFIRDTTVGATHGNLTQVAGTAGCASTDGADESGSPTTACIDGRGLVRSNSLAVSNDGTNIYAGSALSTSSLAHLHRDAVTGALSQSADATGCYAHAPGGTSIDVECTPLYPLIRPSSIAMTKNGVGLAVIGNDSTDSTITMLNVDAATGALSTVGHASGCAMRQGSPVTGCTEYPGLTSPQSVAFSPDGHNMYAGAFTGVSLSTFVRPGSKPSCSALTPTSLTSVNRTAAAARISCSDADQDPFTFAVGTAPLHGALSSVVQLDGSTTYTPQLGFAGTDTFTLVATDAFRTSTPVTFTVTVTDTIAPLISGTKVTRKKWSLSASKAKRSTTVRYRTNEKVTVTATLQRYVKGRWRTVSARVHRDGGKAGSHSLKISTKWGTKRVKAGSYRVRLVAVDASRNRSKIATAKFRVTP